MSGLDPLPGARYLEEIQDRGLVKLICGGESCLANIDGATCTALGNEACNGALRAARLQGVDRLRPRCGLLAQALVEKIGDTNAT